MPGPRGTRRPTAALLVGAACLVALAAGCGTEDESASPDPPTTSAATAAETTEVDGATWCTAFRTFAGAQATYVGSPDDPASVEALESTAGALLALRPEGLTDGGLASLHELVTGSLPEGSTTEPSTVLSDGTPDPEAFDAYLADTCPA